MLLAGPPGVGKTLTAESVAEAMRAPLYSIGAADLGTKAAAMENKLNDMLEMCAKWNAGTSIFPFGSVNLVLT
jgi:ATP-dependent 26S proteasome regulatory subunit